MVQISNEEAYALSMGKERDPRMDLLRASARLHIPLGRADVLKKIAPLLRGLAEQFEFAAHRQGVDEYERLRSAQDAVKTVERRIRELAGGSTVTHFNGTYAKGERDS